MDLNILSNEYEVCALCGDETDVRVKMPIEARKYYIDGVGLLCPKCYTMIIDQNADDNDG